jgi:hypothetical protein
VKIEGMLWIEVESTPTPPFLFNFEVDIVGFVNPHKMVIKRSVFSVLPSACNGNKN